MNPEVDSVSQLLTASAHVLAGQAASAQDGGAQLATHFASAASQAGTLAQLGLLPLCLALLILHENYRSATEGGVFRVGLVLGKTAAILALVLSYSQVCGLLTYVAGGGGWVSGSDLLSGIDQAQGTLGDVWKNLNGFSEWPKFVLILIVSVILLSALLFAYVAGLLLSLCQSAILTILLILGKPCIVASLVPGVDVGKSWAKALAQVAAWSMVAGVITKLLGGHQALVHDMVMAGAIGPMLKTSGQFVVFALGTLAVPVIVSMLFSGAASGAAGGFMGALATGYMAVKTFGRTAQGAAASKPAFSSSPSGNGSPSQRSASSGARTHKFDFDRASARAGQTSLQKRMAKNESGHMNANAPRHEITDDDILTSIYSEKPKPKLQAQPPKAAEAERKPEAVSAHARTQLEPSHSLRTTIEVDAPPTWVGPS